MLYQSQNFNYLLGLKGFSNKALQIHFKLYQGYIKNTNKLIERLKQSTLDSAERAELKRRLGWEFNGMRLHEIYFNSLSKKNLKLDVNSRLAQQIKKDFGSFNSWKKDFKTTASARGIGWAILYWDPRDKKLLNTWIEQHHSGHPAGLTPILPLDMFEHAFLVDYKTDKKKYINAFFNALDYNKINQRIK